MLRGEKGFVNNLERYSFIKKKTALFNCNFKAEIFLKDCQKFI